MTIKETVKKNIPKFLIRIYHFKLALLGAIFFGFPGYSKNMKIIGVTGTSGKSTTCDMITSVLDEDGKKTAAISTIRFKIRQKEWENKYKMTMPGRFVIQRFLAQARKAGCQFVVLEVTSQGIEQFRHKFINFDTAVFTNLSPEHIESHGSFENYRNAKLKLFKATKNIHIINADDKNAEYFLKISARRIIKFSSKDKVVGQIKLNLEGDFNIMNALAAISVGAVYGVNFEKCKKALEKVKGVSGRMEIISESPKIVIDYAHTPEQLESVYKSFAGKNLVCVLGSCGGGRDKWKRPVLGQIAQKYCREIILTNEDPYDEDPVSIMNEIETGFSKSQIPKSNAQKIIDRREAIRTAIKLAKPDDIVIITGKGSEPWMCVANGKKIPWSDRQIVKDTISSRTVDIGS